VGAPPIFLRASAACRRAPLLLGWGFWVGWVALSLYLRRRLKGLIVAIQWAKRMHGFRDTP